MNAISRRVIYAWVGALFASLPGHASIPNEIARVESGLLPPVLIAGEAPYTLDDRMEHHHIPGVAIAVIRDFEILWSRVYGLADQEAGRPVDDETLFAIGSLSKAVTAVGVLRLVQEGKIDLDGDINAQLRTWQLPENEFTQQATVTPRLLMNHSGGMKVAIPESFPASGVPTLRQHLNGEPPTRRGPVGVDCVPGTRFQYSNAGFSILQLLIEEVSGLPFDEYMRAEIFEPLGMEHSTFAAPLPESLRAIAAAGHDRLGRTLGEKQYYIPNSSAGGLWTTAPDYARLVIELQLSLHGRSNRILDPELVDAMLSPQAASEYGLGVFLQGETNFGHIGDLVGFVAGFAAHRTDGYGAVVCTNGLGGIALVREILLAIGSVYDWQDFLPEVRTPCTLPEDFQQALIGRYRIGPDALATISWEEERLILRTPDLPVLRLYPTAPDTFICRERPGELTFSRDEAGRALAVHIGFADEVGRFPKITAPAPRMAADVRLPSEMIAAGDADQALEAYLELQRTDPNAPALRELRFNAMGYRYVQEGRLDLATAVFQINVALYPKSANCYDSLGEAYMLAGRRELAIENYEHSLKLNPGNQNAVNMLARLRGQ